MPSDSESSSDDRVPLEVFAFSEFVGIKMMGGKEFTIRAKFIQEVEGAKFIKLDFRKSRGICQLLTARVEKRMSAIEKRRLFGIAEGAVNVLETLRNKRDVSIKAVVLAGGATPARGFQPRRNTKAHARFVGQTDWVEVTCIAVQDGEQTIAEETVIKCLAMKRRRNRNSQLWVGLESKALDYITRVVAFQAASTTINEGTTPSYSDTPDNRVSAAPIDDAPSAFCTPQKRPRIFDALMMGAKK